MATFDRKDDPLYVRWAHEVKKRDHWHCQICGRRGIELNSHHLNGWNAFPDERYDIDNGITLCAGNYNGKLSCHENFHKIYGKGGNTKEQFDEFRILCEILIKVADKNITVERKRDAILQKLKDGYATAL